MYFHCSCKQTSLFMLPHGGVGQFTGGERAREGGRGKLLLTTKFTYLPTFLQLLSWSVDITYSKGTAISILMQNMKSAQRIRIQEQSPEDRVDHFWEDQWLPVVVLPPHILNAQTEAEMDVTCRSTFCFRSSLDWDRNPCCRLQTNMLYLFSTLLLCHE